MQAARRADFQPGTEEQAQAEADHLQNLRLDAQRAQRAQRTAEEAQRIASHASAGDADVSVTKAPGRH